MKHKVPVIVICGMWKHVIISYSQYGHHKLKYYLINKVSEIYAVKIIKVICAQKFRHKIHVVP